MSLSVSLLRGLRVFRDRSDESTALASQLSFARNAAIKSNQTVYFEIDLDSQSYYAYKMKRSEEKVSRHPVLKKTTLPPSNIIVSVVSPFTSSKETGIIRLPFLPSGLAEEIIIYMGKNSSDIHSTIIYQRYSSKASVFKGKKEYHLEDEEWEESGETQ